MQEQGRQGRQGKETPQVSPADGNVLAAASGKEKKYYLNPVYEKLPSPVKEELRRVCIPLAEEFSQTVLLVFDDDGALYLRTEPDPEDYLYDDIGSGLRVAQLQRAHRELFEQLEAFRAAMRGNA